jgi:hypothetical protein
VRKLADSEGGGVEQTGVQRIPDRWRGEPVEVIHQIQQGSGLSIGPTTGVVEETDVTGILISVTDPQIIAPLG